MKYFIKTKHRPIRSLVVLTCTFIIVSSCDDFIDVDLPKTEIIDEAVYSDDRIAQSAVAGMYGDMIAFGAGFAAGGTRSVTILGGMASDELFYYASNIENIEISENRIQSSNSRVESGLWTACYEIIYQANSILEGLNGGSGLSDTLRLQLEGEAKFVRAFCHLYLVNLFGDIPLVTTTNFEITSNLSRMNTNEVYDQIITDLREAEVLLLDTYITGEKVRVNKACAQALLSRVFLYLENWQEAENYASLVIENPFYSLQSDLNEVFLANSNETIWQLAPVQQGVNTAEGFFLRMTTYRNSIAGVQMFQDLIDSFDPTDLRLTNWIESVTSGADIAYYSSKYKVRFGAQGTEYSMVLRLAEQYLIRAEARARLNNIAEAIGDIDIIRNRAGLPLISVSNPTIDQNEILDEILIERRHEFFCEWSHRWFDLKRFNKINVSLL